MRFNKRPLAFLLLSVFSILMLHQAIPHYDHLLETDFHHHDEHGEHRGEKHDEPKGDFQRVPSENHSETSTSDYLTEARVSSKKKNQEDRDVFDLYLDEPTEAAQVNTHKVNRRLVLFEYSSLCHCTYSLRGPPLFV